MLSTFLYSLVVVLALHIKGVPNGTKKANLDSNLKKRDCNSRVWEKDARKSLKRGFTRRGCRWSQTNGDKVWKKSLFMLIVVQVTKKMQLGGEGREWVTSWRGVTIEQRSETKSITKGAPENKTKKDQGQQAQVLSKEEAKIRKERQEKNQRRQRAKLCQGYPQ